MMLRILPLLLLATACGGAGLGPDGGDVDGQSGDDDTSCTVPVRNGMVSGQFLASGETFSWPEIACLALRERDGTTMRLRVGFGHYDASQPEEPELLLETFYYGHALSQEQATVHVDRASQPRLETGGTVDFDPLTMHGHFESFDLELDFTCDPVDDLAAEGPAAPDQAAPGQAIVSLSFGPVIVVHGIHCDRAEDRQLHLFTAQGDGAPCGLSAIDMWPESQEPILGVGTYPAYFSRAVKLMPFFMRETPDVDATLDIQAGPPYVGFATFPDLSPTRVEFACPAGDSP
jgi:hypothetical protein